MIFDGLAHPLTAPAIMAAKIGLTPKILADYVQNLAGSVAFQAWFAAAQASNRLVIRQANDAPQSLSGLLGESLEYGVAAYFAGGQLFADGSSVAGLNVAQLNALGFSVHDVRNGPPKHIAGDNPMLSLSLVSGGAVDFNVLDPFLACEDQVVIYDKYVDAVALQLIEHIARSLRAGTSLHIRTTQISARCKTPAQILARVRAANSSITASCEEVSVAFRQLAHDRYVFFGERLQAVFTAGLGCFGPRHANGFRRNKQSKINVYALDSFSPLIIESMGGGQLTVNHVSEFDC